MTLNARAHQQSTVNVFCTKREHSEPLAVDRLRCASRHLGDSLAEMACGLRTEQVNLGLHASPFGNSCGIEQWPTIGLTLTVVSGKAGLLWEGERSGEIRLDGEDEELDDEADLEDDDLDEDGEEDFDEDQDEDEDFGDEGDLDDEEEDLDDEDDEEE